MSAGEANGPGTVLVLGDNRNNWDFGLYYNWVGEAGSGEGLPSGSAMSLMDLLQSVRSEAGKINETHATKAAHESNLRAGADEAETHHCSKRACRLTTSTPPMTTRCCFGRIWLQLILQTAGGQLLLLTLRLTCCCRASWTQLVQLSRAASLWQTTPCQHTEPSNTIRPPLPPPHHNSPQHAPA